MSINKIMAVTEVFVSKNLVNITKKSKFACYLATCRLFFNDHMVHTYEVPIKLNSGISREKSYLKFEI